MPRKAVITLAVLLVAGAARAPGAVIEGVVSEKATGLPLARARVSLTVLQGTRSAVPAILTDSLGHFSFPRLGAGTYFLSAEKSGYAMARYGQKRWNGAGAPILLQQDSRVSVALPLSRMGAVSGEVVDENGVGLQDLQVFAYRDTKPLRQAGQGSTDDRGAFRIAGLEPGRYRIRTAAKELEDGTALLPTFLGDAAAAENSSAIDVQLDAETSGVRIRPVPGELAKLSGRVTFPGPNSVVLYSDLGRRSAGLDPSGRFSFDQLSPGSYEVLAESGGGAPQVGYARVLVNADVEGVILDPMPAPAVQLRCEDTDGKTVAGREVSLYVRRATPPEDPRGQMLNCGVRASFGVGAWVISASTPSSVSLAQVEIQREEIRSNELALMPGQTVEVTLVLSSRSAALKGTVTGPDGQPAAGAMVFLRALDKDVARRLFAKGSGRTDESGAYEIKGLPAGRYELMASSEFQTLDEVDWEGAELKEVELVEGREITLDLTM